MGYSYGIRKEIMEEDEEILKEQETGRVVERSEI